MNAIRKYYDLRVRFEYRILFWVYTSSIVLEEAYECKITILNQYLNNK